MGGRGSCRAAAASYTTAQQELRPPFPMKHMVFTRDLSLNRPSVSCQPADGRLPKFPFGRV